VLALAEQSSGRTWTHAELAADVAALAGRLGEVPRSLIFCRCRIDAGTVIAYLAARAAGHVVALVDDGAAPELMQSLEERYAPALVLHPSGAIETRPDAPAHELHPDLSVLLPTSGTTGNPKLVRLSAANLDANAASIVEYLGIGSDERAIASLPFHYSYGLSVLNSHLRAGAAVVLPAEGLIRPSFWEAFEAYGCTSFAGVPYSYALLERTGWDRRDLPTLRTMTQAGGRLEPAAQLRFHDQLRRRGARLVVMYGQTEATARIAWVPPERLGEKAGSIGVPIPGGRLTIEDEHGAPVRRGDDGELVYRGPNVMLGYARTVADLARGDDLGGVLRTGDLGHEDDDGYVFVTGRSARFAKVYGLRVSLDDIERQVLDGGPVAAIAGAGERVHVFVEANAERPPEAVRAHLARAFRLASRTWDVRELPALPLVSSGKVDYAALGRLVDA
jgi:acyl-coenzyme A synthetase/AMP-(fatty) acid ligase